MCVFGHGMSTTRLRISLHFGRSVIRIVGGHSTPETAGRGGRSAVVGDTVADVAGRPSSQAASPIAASAKARLAAVPIAFDAPIRIEYERLLP